MKGNGLYTAGKVIAIGLAVAMSTIHASDEFFGIEGRELDDRELAGMRGKFVQGSKVVYFGVKMQTEWQFSNGATRNMEMQIDIDNSGSGSFNSGSGSFNSGSGSSNSGSGSFNSGPGSAFQPVLAVYRTQSIGNKTDSPPTAPLENVTGADLSNTSGVVQNIQVAGDTNGVVNDVSWEITDQPVQQQTINPELIAVAGSGNQAYLDDSGVVTEVLVGSEGVGFSVELPGEGKIIQTIQGGGRFGRGLLQSSQLSGNLNRIRNNMHLTVRVAQQDLQAVHRQSVRSALQSLRGIR